MAKATYKGKLLVKKTFNKIFKGLESMMAELRAHILIWK